jgi:hypothetical protein
VSPRAARTTPSAPYEELLRTSRAELVLRDGWVLGRYPAVALEPPIDWSFRDQASRSHNFHLHSLDLIDPLLAAHSAGETGHDYLGRAFAVALDWVRNHPEPATAGSSPMAWYDMAIGLRAYRLAYLYDEARRIGLGSEEERELLRASLEAHRDALINDESFAAHSNHGLYQASGQLAMARRLSDLRGMGAAALQARERLAASINAQFTTEGVHKEHSPGYHLRVLETLTGIEKAGLLDTPELQAVARRARESLGWFVKPDGRLVNFGDTDNGRPASALLPAAPLRGLKVFPRSGYVIARGGDSILAQTLAYHSRTHKQADDLSFVWSEHGRDILIDAGRYGYRGKTAPGSDLWKLGFWYGDPNRVFVESTHAHNTVEIGGQSYNRRLEQPYGSALLRAETTGEGLVVSLGEVDHGEQGRHRRVLVYRPGGWVLVIDRLAPSSVEAGRKGLLGLGGPKSVTYRQWFHFAPEFRVQAVSATAFAAEEQTGETRVRGVALAPGVAVTDVAAGQTEPRLQGWTSPRDGELVPAPAVAMETSSRGPVLFATVLTLDADEVRPAGAQITAAGDGLRLGWTADGTTTHVEVAGFLSDAPKVASTRG